MAVFMLCLNFFQSFLHCSIRYSLRNVPLNLGDYCLSYLNQLCGSYIFVFARSFWLGLALQAPIYQCHKCVEVQYIEYSMKCSLKQIGDSPNIMTQDAANLWKSVTNLGNHINGLRCIATAQKWTSFTEINAPSESHSVLLFSFLLFVCLSREYTIFSVPNIIFVLLTVLIGILILMGMVLSLKIYGMVLSLKIQLNCQRLMAQEFSSYHNHWI